MLKSLLIFLCSITINYAQADQQSVLNSEDAKKTVEFLETQNEIILFCGCCSSDTYDKITLSSVSYDCQYLDWCKVRVQGINVATKEEVNTTIDLAYTWINLDGITRNLAWEMGLNADPCTDSFDWETYGKVLEITEVVYTTEELEVMQTSFQMIKELLESHASFVSKPFEKGEVFTVKTVNVEADAAFSSITISHIGDNIEQRYTISMNLLEGISQQEDGILFKTMNDGVIMVEESRDSKINYRMFEWWCTIPVPNSSIHAELEKHFEIIKNIHDSKPIK